MSPNQPAQPASKRERWEVVEDLLAEAEAERIEGLSDEALSAELRAAGFDPDAVPSVEALIARGQARAAARAKERNGVDGHGNVRVLRAPAKRANGPVPARRVLWLAAAAVLLALGSVGVVERRAIVAIFTRSPAPPFEIQPLDRQDEERVIAERLREEARKLREEAQKACAGALWGRCEDRLDQAKVIDPVGDGEPDVQMLRSDIREHATMRLDDKGPVDEPPRRKP
jgi:hypothetical protein